MLKDILAISGYGGLYKYLKKSHNGVIIENLETGKRMNADAAAQISALEDISVYTEEGDLALEKVFKAIYEKENGHKAINPKKASGKELENYFEEIIPDFDKDRVYASDMKKILKWYNLLHKLDMLNFQEEEEKEEENKGNGESSEEKESQENKDVSEDHDKN
jgi:hypothetical protein